MKYLKEAIPNIIVLIFGASFTFSGYLLNENRKLRNENQSYSEGIKEVENTYKDIRGCKLSTPTAGLIFPPMQVVFKDGVLNYVNWYYRKKLSDDFRKLFEEAYQNPEIALEVEMTLEGFANRVTEESLSRLESYTSHEARVNRKGISKMIVSEINAQESPIKVKDFVLLGFCVPLK